MEEVGPPAQASEEDHPEEEDHKAADGRKAQETEDGRKVQVTEAAARQAQEAQAILRPQVPLIIMIGLTITHGTIGSISGPTRTTSTKTKINHTSPISQTMKSGPNGRDI